MPEQEIIIKHSISEALKAFMDGNLTASAISFFQTLGYNTTRQEPLGSPTYTGFYESYAARNTRFRADKAYVDEWTYVDLLFQLSKDELSTQMGTFDTGRVDNTIIESYLFFVIGLSGAQYTRTALSQITREINKIFPMPAMLLFKHGSTLTLSIIDRRLHKKDEQKDVFEKVTLIKDIQIESIHRAHLEILFDLSLKKLTRLHTITNFVELHNAWQKTLDTQELNKRFYQELSNWYFWALQEVSFPDDVEKNPEIRNATNLIRLITRIIFIWFIKEKSLVPEALFQPATLKRILKDFCKDHFSHSYYQAILQNLFFGILNKKIEDRKFARDEGFLKNRSKYGIKTLLRFEKLFKISQEEVLGFFKDVPFLNGGLFDCLDKEDANGKVIYVDGFSRNNKKQAVVPDYLFFGGELEIDLNSIYGTRNKKYKTKGLIEILANYKFTVTENTPIEEEVALDPELLGKVFENLLASYNPETQTTARKQTGSFYTPREIVNYMVDESLIAYLAHKLGGAGYTDREEDLRGLLGYTENPNPFNEQETAILIKSINDCKILDLACGSGAFPMGVLHKLVHILHKLDPQNELWKERQIENAQAIEDPVLRDKSIRGIEEAFENEELDYGRKLYLIENCIYGVDIQPIAVQIAKLRFFISLVINQQKQPGQENYGINALPNLETKFVAANTLIPLEKPEGQITMQTYDLPKIETLKNKLKQIRHRYFNAKTRTDKLRCQEQDKTTREELARHLIESRWDEHAAQQLAAFDPYDQNASAPFFDPEWMFGVNEGFDIVIGNPPYVEHKKLKFISSQLRKHYKTYSGTADLYVYFFEKGINTLKDNGILVFITSNKFIKTSYGKKLRGLFVMYSIDEIVDFTEIHIFDALVASCIFRITKNKVKSNYFPVVMANDNVLSYSSFHRYVKENSFKVGQHSLNSDIWQLVEKNKLDIKNIIETGSLTISNIDTINIFRGITTGYNPAYIISEEIKKILITNQENADIIKPLLQGRHIKRWNYLPSNEHLLFIPWHFPLHKDMSIKGASKKAEKYFRERYCGIYQHLEKYRNKLCQRNVEETGIRYEWYALQRCASTYYEEFSKEKIVWGLTADKWAFAYDKDNHYLPSNGYLLTSEKIPIKYLLACLNSRVMKFYFSFIGIMTAGGAFTLKHETVSQFPIKVIKQEWENAIINLVNIILYCSLNKTQQYFFERLIDSMIYELYLPNVGDECKMIDRLKGFPIIDAYLIKGEIEKANEIAELVFKELNSPTHPVRIAMEKMKEIPEIKIIEGRA